MKRLSIYFVFLEAGYLRILRSCWDRRTLPRRWRRSRTWRSGRTSCSRSRLWTEKKRREVYEKLSSAVGAISLGVLLGFSDKLKLLFWRTKLRKEVK